MRHFFLVSCLLLPMAAWGQALEPDAEGCKESQIVTRMPRCRISECSVKEFDAAELLIGLKEGEALKKSLEGKVETLEFECAEGVSLLQVERNVEGALRKAGFAPVYAGKDDHDNPAATLRKGGQWVEVITWKNGGPLYRQTAVTVQEMAQVVEADASAWAAEIEKTGRVAVYGVNFDTGKATITADSASVLSEMVKLLNGHLDWKMRVEGHIDNVGAKAMNQALSQKRAEAVSAWLAAHGVDKTRLTAQGLGDTKPVADNTSDDGRAKNRRVELVKI